MAKKHFWSICTDSYPYQTFCSTWFRIGLMTLLVGLVIWRYSTLSENEKKRVDQKRRLRQARRDSIRLIVFSLSVIVYFIYYYG